MVLFYYELEDHKNCVSTLSNYRTSPMGCSLFCFVWCMNLDHISFHGFHTWNSRKLTGNHSQGLAGAWNDDKCMAVKPVTAASVYFAAFRRFIWDVQTCHLLRFQINAIEFLTSNKFCISILQTTKNKQLEGLLSLNKLNKLK